MQKESTRSSGPSPTAANAALMAVGQPDAGGYQGSVVKMVVVAPEGGSPSWPQAGFQRPQIRVTSAVPGTKAKRAVAALESPKLKDIAMAMPLLAAVISECGDGDTCHLFPRALAVRLGVHPNTITHWCKLLREHGVISTKWRGTKRGMEFGLLPDAFGDGNGVDPSGGEPAQPDVLNVDLEDASQRFGAVAADLLRAVLRPVA